MNVLFIDIDTLRADHMGTYGYHRNTTPNMDKICLMTLSLLIFRVSLARLGI